MSGSEGTPMKGLAKRPGAVGVRAEAVPYNAAFVKTVAGGASR